MLFYHKVENQVFYKLHLIDVSINLAFKEACFLNLKAAKSISQLWEVIGAVIGAEEKNLTPSTEMWSLHEESLQKSKEIKEEDEIERPE